MTANLRRSAVYETGPLAWVSWLGYLLTIGAVVGLIVTLLDRESGLNLSWLLAAFALGLAVMIGMGYAHQNVFFNRARREGLSDVEAKALWESAQEEADEVDE